MAPTDRVVLSDPLADPWLRRLLALQALLLLAAGVMLLRAPAAGGGLVPAPAAPATALLLGACALGAAAVLALAARQRLRPRLRIALPFAGVLAWTLLALGGVHVARLEAGSGAWAGAAPWLAAALLAPLQLGLGLAQGRRSLPAAPPAAPMSGLSRGVLAGLALALALPVALLLAVPARAAALWPWPLALLDAGLLGAALLALAVLCAHAACDGDWERAAPAPVGVALAALAAFAALAAQPAPPRDSLLPAALATVGGLAALLALQALRRLAALPRPQRMRWRVAASLDEVAGLLRDTRGYARWWGTVCHELHVMLQGDRRGVGQLLRLRARGPAGGSLALRLRVLDERLPRAMSLGLDGDLQGRLDWRLSAHGPWVDIQCSWVAAPTRPLWRAAWFALRPLLEAQQRWAMRRGEAGLRAELVARRRLQGEAAHAGAARRPPASRSPLAGLRELGAGRVLRLQHRALVERPVAEVFDFAARLDNDALWRREVLRVEQRVDGPRTGIGRTLRVTLRLAGRRVRRELCVVAWQPGLHVAYDSMDGGYRSSREFEALDDATCITETEDIVLPWWLRPLAGLVAAAASRSAAAAYGRLGELLEQPGPTEPADELLRTRPA